MAEQSLLTGFKEKSLIEVSSEHTPINFPLRKNRFNTDLNDLTTTVTASGIAESTEARQFTSPLFTQEREVSANPFCVSDFQHAAASGSQLQRASSIVVNPWQSIDSGSSWIKKQGIESFSSVEKSLLRGKRDRESGIVCHCLNMNKKDFCLKDKNLHEYFE